MRTTTMKTKLIGRMSIAALFAITAVFFLSCDNPVGLGAMLDLEGPLVEFSSPAPRQALLAEFDIEGVVSDKTGVDRMLLTAERTIAVKNSDDTETYETVTYAKQWRYENGKWEVSANSGASWAALPGAGAAGPTPGRTVTNAVWSVPIDMKIGNPPKADDGIYLFKIQAWDSGGFTGDSSTKTIVLIVDQFPPKVTVIDPYIYNRQSYIPATNTFTDPDGLKALHDIADNDEGESRKSVNIGLFMTRDFNLKWQIDDEYDIGSIDIYFCDYDTNIDGVPETPIDPAKTYYHHREPLPKPNGLTRVPDLTGKRGTQDKDGEILQPILQKTTIMVVGVCKDVAGNSNNEKDENGDEEKILGYFVYWPKADEPWIEYPAKMDDPYDEGYFTAAKNKVDDLKDMVLMVYPERSIKPAAYQAHGVSKVRYALYQCEEERDDPLSPTGPTNPIRLNGKLKLPDYYKSVNNPREFGDSKILSTNFTWEIIAPSRPGYYVVVAIPYGPEGYVEGDESGKDIGSPADFTNTAIEKFTAIFRVQDISFPEFLPGYPLPSATEPLFRFIGSSNGDPAFSADPVADGEIMISGRVDDAVEIRSLLMVWINPQSRNYSAMSQLRYFSDPAYEGWNDAAKLTEGTNDVEDWDNHSIIENYPYDKDNRNRLWKLVLPPPDEDLNTYRKVYSYSQIIDLAADLNIGAEAGQNPLKSQMFLLRAQNPDGKATVITYAPQGDAAVPTIEIKNVQVRGVEYTPSQGFIQIPQFLDADTPAKTITVNGTWEEDSTEYLDNQTYFYNNMVFSINGITIRRNKLDPDPNTTWVAWNGVTAPVSAIVETPLNGITVTVNPTASANPATSGTFTIVATVGTAGSTNTLKTSDLRDTLVVNASVRDYGGNPSEDGASWLIESDKLRFLRISSLAEDRAYRAGAGTPTDPFTTIDIFIEFNKPVVLKSGRAQPPVLLLNATGGTTTTGTAAYKGGQVNESTRHYFTYTVGSAHNTDRLNVTGISIDGGSNALAVNSTAWQNANYPFTFVHTNIDNTTEEIRLTRNSAHVAGTEITSATNPGVIGTPFFVRIVPVNATQPPPGDITTNPDYIYTLGGGKAISVDTTPPAITDFSVSPAGWHKAGVEIYITATFSENVKLGTTTPYLTLNNTYTGTNTNRTSTNTNDIRVNNKQITFKYTVLAGDSTAGAQLAVTGFSGDIWDIPENRMTSLPPITGTGAVSRTLTGVYLDTATPATPSIAVFSGVNGVGTPAQITGTTLGALYDDNLFIRFSGTGTAGDNVNLGKVEYSLNGSGTNANWIPSTTPVTNIVVRNKELHQVSVRQTDQAGNQSLASAITSFTWDPGALITRISSTSPNGTYTHIPTPNSTNGNVINVTVTFRKPLTFAGTPTITLNATRPNNANPPVYSNITLTNPTNTTNSLSFTYTVQNGDIIADNAALDVTGISGLTVTDNGAAVAARYLVLPAAAEAKLAGNKQIKVETGNLIRSAMSFTDLAGDGIQQADGSYWTTLLIPFNHGINKGSGEITIEQIAGTGNTSYRLPTVLTEAQYNRFRGVSVTVGGNVYNFDTYYTKGTNGYTYTSAANQGADTSAKYVLNYQYNPNSTVTGNDNAFNGDRPIQPTFFTAFRTAEKITINVNSQSVDISGGNTLRVRLNGSNAPQVPGATYQITYPAGLVNDSLGNTSAEATAVAANQVTLGGVAKPFVRIRKTQDTINNNANPSATVPRLTAAQPRYAYVRMDSRTPGATIQYTATEHTYTASNNNWSTSTGPNYNTTTVVSGGTTYTNPASVTLTRPGTPATTFNNNNNNMAIPTTANETGIRGYKWWVRARATVGNVNSLETEEMAYRTAITYRLRSSANENQGADMLDPLNSGQGSEVTSGQQRVGNGDQIWIRGGDAIGSSTIPGFPFTWKDDFAGLRDNNKRAGIRLMTLRGTNSTPTGNTGTASLNNSTWEFMTWDMNAIAYVDFILGRDANVTLGSQTYDVSSNNEAWQYGPRLWAYHRGGWTGSNTQYPIYPGEHRWLDIGQQTSGIPINFSSVFESRPDLTNNVTLTP